MATNPTGEPTEPTSDPFRTAWSRAARQLARENRETFGLLREFDRGIPIPPVPDASADR